MTNAERQGRIGELLHQRVLVKELLERIDQRLGELGYEAATTAVPDLDAGIGRMDPQRGIRALIREVYPHIEHDRDVTLRLFLYIESHPRLLRRYERLRNEFGSSINARIGKDIRAMYGLENTGKAEAQGSRLIKWYTRH